MRGDGLVLKSSKSFVRKLRGILVANRFFEGANSFVCFGDNRLPRCRFGGRGWNRTTNLSIKSRMLCQLSYASVERTECWATFVRDGR